MHPMTKSELMELALDYGNACARAACAPPKAKADRIAERYDALKAFERALASFSGEDR